MPLTVTVTLITATTARLNFAGIPAGNDSFDVQLSPRRDFKWCVCPIFNVPTGATYDLAGLNQVQNYYGRARGVDGGVAGAWSDTFAFRTALAAAQVTAPAAIMIEPAIIMTPEPVFNILAGTAGVGSIGELPGYPVANLLRDAPVAWRAYSGNVPNPVYYFSVETAGQPIDTVALLNTNLPEAATISVYGDDAARWDSGKFQDNDIAFRASANLPGRPGYHGLIQLGGLRQARFVTVKIMPNGVIPGRILHAEHAILGRARKSKNHAVEKKETPLDLGSLERSRTGVPDRILGLKMRRVDFDIAMLSESQYETLYGDLGRLVGETEPVLVVPNSKRNFAFHDRILYGNLSGGNITNPASPYYTRSFSIDSII